MRKGCAEAFVQREERKRAIRADFSCESLGEGETFCFLTQISRVRDKTA